MCDGLMYTEALKLLLSDQVQTLYQQVKLHKMYENPFYLDKIWIIIRYRLSMIGVQTHLGTQDGITRLASLRLGTNQKF